MATLLVHICFSVLLIISLDRSKYLRFFGFWLRLLFWWTLLVPQSFLFPDTYTYTSMFNIFSLNILEGRMFILFLYVYFFKRLFSPFIWRKAKTLVLWWIFPMNTDFPKRSLFLLIGIFISQLQPSTLQVASRLKYGDDFRDADFLKKYFLNTQTQWQFRGCKNSFSSSVHLGSSLLFPPVVEISIRFSNL